MLVEGSLSDLSQVVPMPAPMPAVFPSIDDYQQYLAWRLSVLSQREQQLRALARPPSRRRRIALGFTGAALGLGVAYFCTIATVVADAPSQREQRTMAAVAIAGVVGAVAGLTLAIVTLARRPYRHELQEVRRDHDDTAQRWRDVNAERGRLSMQLSANHVGLRLQF